MKELVAQMTPGSSALFVLLRKSTGVTDVAFIQAIIVGLTLLVAGVSDLQGRGGGYSNIFN